MVIPDTETFATVFFPFSHHAAQPSTGENASHFLVTSFGHCGSIWLAGSLNLHDAVCATAGFDNPIECFALYPLNRDAAPLMERAGLELSRYGFGNPDRPDFSGFRSAIRARGLDIPLRNTARLPWYVFDELALAETTTPFQAIGNVHGITYSQMHEAHRAEPDVFKGRQVLVADLIRHPVGRTESAINGTIKYHLTALEPRISAFIHAHADECLALERAYKVDFSEPRPRAALHVYRQGLQNDVWAYELRTFPNAHRILLERLQSEPEYFAHVFSLLTQGRLAAERAYLDRVFAPKNLGSGRQSTAENARPLGPREQYERWSPFERAEFARINQRLGAPALYFPFGYDFSFVERGAVGNGSWFSEMFSSLTAAS